MPRPYFRTFTLSYFFTFTLISYLCGMKCYHTIFMCAAVLLLAACGRTTAPSDHAEADSTLTVSYATGFAVDYFDDYKRVTINNPWSEGDILATYYLVRADSVQTPADGNKIRIPIERMAVTSCTHYAFLEAIGEIDAIVGVCNPELAYNATVRRRFANGEIAALGDAFNTNTERLLALHPDALMLASYNQQDDNSKRLQTSGIPLIFNNEWTESTMLARAEWVKLVAVFYDKELLADSLFAAIESDYRAAAETARAVTHKPTVMAGGNFKGTWYMPGGKGYMAQLFADAGADYFYKNDGSTGSLPLNFETVLHNFSQADVWLNAPTATLDELLAMDARHKLFKAAKNGDVYGFYARTLAGGANDFWESGVVRPDLILKDMIWALHPELSDGYRPVYINKLGESL